jgi:alpha-tubulin suppressor-like RCC1 family protein
LIHQRHHHLDADIGAGARFLHLHDDCDGYKHLCADQREFERDEHFHGDRVQRVGAPFAFTQPATSVTGTSAQLNGMATPNGLPTTAWFQWGTTTFTETRRRRSMSALLQCGLYDQPDQRSGAERAVSLPAGGEQCRGVVYGFDQILDEANVVVWGADYVGQANVPSGLSNVVAIAGAYDHSLALKNNGTAVAWGDNTFGQANVPAGLNNLVAVAGGEYYSMALKNSGTVAAWGANILGQTNVPAGLNNVVTIAGGTYSSLALRNDGTVVAWGANFFGLTNVPAGLNNAVAIAGGSYHNLAIKNDGTVMAWGDNSAGQTERARRSDQCGGHCGRELSQPGLEIRWDGGGLG